MASPHPAAQPSLARRHQHRQGTTVEFVTARLRDAILSGSLAPDQPLSLRKIATRLGVSFIPVREAFRSLAGEGLLETRPGRSAVVTELTLEELSSICRLCRQIEPDIRARAATLLAPSTLDRLTTLANMTSSNAKPTEESYARRHELHTELVRPATTASELRILHQLWRALDRYIRASHRGAADTVGLHLPHGRSTRELLTAYRTNDSRAVRLATLAHLEEQERTAQRAVSPDSSTIRP